MGAFERPIQFENTGRRSRGRPILRLIAPLVYDPGRGLEIVRVPCGVETDLASVPRFLWRIASPWDALEPPAVHDWLYRKEADYPRAVADYVFLCGLADVGVAGWRRRLMWAAVRCFGRLAYHAK